MEKLSKEKKQKILDSFGKTVIEDVRDGVLEVSMNIAKYKTPNPIKLKQYAAFSTLSEEQQEMFCDLLSETITETIYRFMAIFEENPDEMKLILTKDAQDYDLVEISEKVGSEIAFNDESGWIQQFSKIGRFVL